MCHKHYERLLKAAIANKLTAEAHMALIDKIRAECQKGKDCL